MYKQGYPNLLKPKYKKDTLFALPVKNIIKNDQNVWFVDALLTTIKYS
jgi:hypothetical protein